MSFLFTSTQIKTTKSLITKQLFRRKAFAYLENGIDCYNLLDFQPKITKGKFFVPDFYKNRSGRDKAVFDLQRSAVCMIACSNVFLINEENRYARKIAELARLWTGSITSYETEQAQYEANWNFQTMVTACSSILGLKKYQSEIKDFFSYDYEQCLKLEKLNSRTNNLRNWLAAHMIVAAIARNDNDLFERACDYYRKAIEEEITEVGYMPQEVCRGNRGIHYTLFAIDALTFIAQVTENNGVNLFSYRYKGKSLKTAIEYVLPYLYHPESWPWSKQKQDFSIFPKGQSGWCEIIFRKWKLKGLKKFIKENRPIFDIRLGGAQTLFNGIPLL